MKNHFVLLILFSILTSLVLTYIAKSGVRERVRYFLWLLVTFVGLSLLAAWLAFPFPF